MSMAIGASTSGIQTTFARQNYAAHNVANINTPGFEQINVSQTETKPGVRISSLSRTPNPDATTSNTDLAEQTMHQMENKADLSANLKAAKVQDRMIGDLLDILA